MAKSNLLTAAHVRNTKEPKLHPDGNGLFLRVTDTGAKSWVFRYRWQGKRPEIGLGGLSEVSLAVAREKVADYRKLIRQGTDPRQAKGAKSIGVPTFDTCITGFMRDKSGEWSNPKHVAQWASTLATYASPVFGRKPVDRVELDDVLEVLAPIWSEKNETASRVRGRIERVLSWATVKGYRQPPNPAIWRGNLDMVLPKPSKVKEVTHHPALPYAELPEFMAELRGKSSLTSKALQFTILTTTRTGEVIAAQWNEIDTEQALWTIPADRMKAKKTHRVPLVPEAMALLDALPRMDGGIYLFPGMKEGRHISNMAMLKFLKQDLGYPDLTVHGFRSAFKDWSVEKAKYPGELSEAQLAHTIKNAAQAAYERGEKLEWRRELLEAWAKYCGGEV